MSDDKLKPVPEGWRSVRLKDVAEIVGGGTPSTNISEYWEGDVPWLTPKDLSGYEDRWISEGSRNISRLGLQKSSAQLLPRNTILITSRAPIGYVAIADNDISTNQGFRSLILNTGNDPKYFYYLIKTLVPTLRMLGSGTTFEEISGATLGKVVVQIPEFKEQQAIGRILGRIDDKIELNRKQNRTLEEIAHALFEAWFVDFYPVRAKLDGHWKDGQSLPGLPEHLFNLFPNRFIQSDSRQIPSGWRFASADELVEFNPRERLSRSEPTPYLGMAGVPITGSWPDTPVPRTFTSGVRFRNGDTLMARITPSLENGKTAFIQYLPDQETIAWGSTEFIVMRPKAPVPPEFGYLLARHQAFRNVAIRSMTGTSGRQRVQIDVIANYKIAVPTESAIWDAFSEVVSGLFQGIKANSLENITLSQLRDALTPDLVSGRTRLSNYA